MNNKNRCQDEEAQLLREPFVLRGKDPQAWLEQAAGHRIIAEMARKRLWELSASKEPPHLRRVETLACMRTYMMLMGFAFENVAKAVLITRDHRIVSSIKLGKWPTNRSGHGLIALFKAILPKVSPEEEYLLLRLEEYVVWAGRYPIPRTSKEYKAAEEGKRFTLGAPDVKRIEGMFSRLEKLVGTYEPRRQDA